MHVQTTDGGTRPVKLCTRCGATESFPESAWKTREFPEEPSFPPTLLQSAASNEANRALLTEMTKRDIRRLQQAIQTLERQLETADGEERESVARALLQARDALQFETETLALLVSGDVPDEPESETEPQQQPVKRADEEHPDAQPAPPTAR